MEVCERYGISHSHFLGGPDEWTQHDRDLAVEYAAYKRGECPQCGTRREWWDPKQGGHRNAFIADLDRCPGCEVKEQLWEQLPREQAKGVHVRLIPNPDLYPPEEVASDER